MREPRRRRGQRGQGMTEYIIIVALIAIGAIFVVAVFGDNIRALLGSSTSTLVGQSTAATELGGTDVARDDLQKDVETFQEGAGVE